jgi:hypothetical protein
MGSDERMKFGHENLIFSSSFHTSDDRPELKHQPNSSERHPIGEVVTGPITATEVLKKVFGCTGFSTGDEILQRVRHELTSRSGIQFDSFSIEANLRTQSSVEERFWADFHSLNEADRVDVASAIQSGLKQYARPRERGRPKGAKGHGTDRQISLAAALQLLDCSRTAMVPFLYPEQHLEAPGKQAIDKLFKRNTDCIKQKRINMTEAFALEIVKAHVTVGLAKRILSLDS